MAADSGRGIPWGPRNTAGLDLSQIPKCNRITTCKYCNCNTVVGRFTTPPLLHMDCSIRGARLTVA